MRTCSGCGAGDQPEGARFCFGCGAPLAAPTCGACGAEIVPGARFCSECGAVQAGPTPQSGPTPPVSARRVTSVLFGDLVGFTALSESRDQEDVRELLSRYFDECRRIISRYGGTVEKFIGDAVMAVWGVPTAHEDDAERAVRAGLELVDAVEAMGQDIGVPKLAMRVGIVTGEVAVTLGADHQGMVAGDAVNTASRVQSVAAPGHVWVDESTRLLTSSAITYLDAGSHLLKGKADPVPLWSVHAVVAGVGGVQRADGLEAPLVARDRELRLVKEAFHGVEESGEPALLVMVGEPGVGKSRLAWEFDKYVDGLTMTTRWHSGRCVAYGEGMAFFALAEAVRARLRTLRPEADLEDENTDLAELLELGLDRYVPDGQEQEWLRPRLGALLGIASVATFPREDLFSAWTAFLERVGEGKYPVVLLIDDAHHADDGLVDFVEHLLSVGTFPCFVLLLSRTGLLERHPGLAANRRATVSHLGALNAADMSLLLDGLVVGLPDTVRDSLVARSEGVPLFAVETIRSLIDRDLVIPRGGRYVLADPGSLDLESIGAPASLQALIAARLDALDADQRRLVERASVIGNSFSRDEIAELCADLADVDGLLAGLVRQQILSQMKSRFSAEFGQFQFVQSVVRQVAYATLARRDRRSIHLAVAHQNESVHDPSGELAPIIAQHYLDAVAAVPDEPDVPELERRAIAALERAAARARALGALTESAGHLLLALDRASDVPTRARLDLAVAWALADAGDYVRTIPHAVAATQAFEGLDDVVSAGLAAAAQGAALSMTGDNAGAVAVVEPRWEALVDLPGAEHALLALGKVYSQAVGRVSSERRDVVDRRIQVAEKLGDLEQLADALTGLSVSYSFMGASTTARTLMAAAADIARAHHFPVALARCLTNLTVDYNLDDLAKGVEIGREATEVAARAGIAVWRDFTEVNLLVGLVSSSRWDELGELANNLEARDSSSSVARVLSAAVRGYVALARGEDFDVPPVAHEVRGSDDPSDQAWVALVDAFAAQAAGREAEALARAVASVDAMHALSGPSDDFVLMWPVAVDLALALGDHAVVQRLLGVLDRDAERMRIPLPVQTHRTRFAGLLARDDEPEVAEEALRRAIDGFERWGSPHHRARTEAELGELLRRTGRDEEAAALLAAARGTLTGLGAHAWLARIEDRETTSQ